MQENTDILIQLKKYANGELHGEERERLEVLLAKDEQLQEELELTRSLIISTEAREKERLLKIVEAVRKENKKPKIIRLFSRYRKLAVAAAITALLAIGIWLFLENNNRYNDFITEAYYPPISHVDRASTDDYDMAYMEFERGNYRKSLQWLNNFTEKDSLFYEALILRGHDYFKLSELENAIKELDTAIEHKNRYPEKNYSDIENVPWTRLLAMLQQVEKNKMDRNVFLKELDYFIENTDRENTYHKKAIELRSLF